MPELVLLKKKTEPVYLQFSVCNVVSWLIAPSFSVANGSISAAAVLSAARECYKNTFSKL